MSQPPSFQLDSFEQLAVNGEFVLLRAAGGAAGAAVVSALIVDDGRERHRIAPLPDPGDDGDQVRAGFSLAAGLVDGSAFALELADGAIVELPEPSRRAASGSDIERLTRALAELEGSLAAMTERAARAEAAASIADAETARALEALRAAELRVTAERDRVEALEARLAEARSAIGNLEPPPRRRARRSEAELDMAVGGERGSVALATTPARESSAALPIGDRALDVARAIAINMALAGRPREEAERLLRDDLGLPDPQAVLDECYGPERWPTPSRGRRTSLRRRTRP